MMKKTAQRQYLALLLIGLAVLLNHFSAGNTRITEEIYASWIYKALSQGLSLITGLYPYSLAEITVVLLLGFILWWLVNFLRTLKAVTRGKLPLFRAALANLLLAGGIIYLLFIMMWGLNYNRSTIAAILDLEIKPASVSELTQVADDLMREANQLRDQMQEDQNGVMHTTGGYRAVLDRAALGYQTVAPEVSELGGRYGSPKPVALSGPWSYTGIWGVYFPFTAEANVNIAIPAPFLPFTTLHEMAHQRGFAREDEANYIAYLVGKNHPDADFRYSGSLMALVHVSRALAQESPELQKEIMGRLSAGVKRDLQALDDFNRHHESSLERVSLKVNDFYLKANRQTDGDKSYGRMVDLLLAEYRARLK